MSKWNINKIEGADDITNKSVGVNLYNNIGQFVAYVPVLPFIVPPEILIWGTRLFVRKQTQAASGKTAPVQYREAEGSYTVLLQSQGQDWVNVAAHGKMTVKVTAKPRGKTPITESYNMEGERSAVELAAGRKFYGQHGYDVGDLDIEITPKTV